MTSIIISIRHEFAEAIYSGLKVFELRKREPRFPTNTKCYIYEPLPVGKVTGYFYYGGPCRMEKTKMWNQWGHRLGIDIDRYMAYYEGQQDAIGWQVLTPKRIDPRPLSDFGIERAPQSYCRAKKEITIK